MTGGLAAWLIAASLLLALPATVHASSSAIHAGRRTKTTTKLQMPPSADGESEIAIETNSTLPQPRNGGLKERRVRKRSKWMQSTTAGVQPPLSPSSSSHFNKDGSFLKRIVSEVIAERDAQIAAALFEVAKNQPHLQMMVQTLGELSQSHQRLELSSTRTDETLRRLDSRLGVISEKMTLLENRLSQTERRIEREMTHVHGKIDDIFRNLPDKPSDTLTRSIKQIQDHLDVVEEILLDRSPQPSNQIRISNGKHRSNSNGNGKHQHNAATSAELQRLINGLSQAISAAHLDLVRSVRETENNLEHQLSMLAADNGVFSCAISRLVDRLPPMVGEENLLLTPLLDVQPTGTNVTTHIHLLEANSIQVSEPIKSNTTKCVLKCP